MAQALHHEDGTTDPSSGVRPSQSNLRRIVIVGHGMVGQRLCEELRARRDMASAKVTIFGEEPQLAYDRVHLCRILRGEPEEAIRLVSDHWYGDNRVAIVPKDPVIAIDRDERLVRAESGRVQSYDHLVLATGATPILAKIPGIDGRYVRALRSANDARVVLENALRCRTEGLPVVIIGGGLLGIELADELRMMEVEVIVLESAEYPMSRQLEPTAGSLLAARLASSGLELRAGVRVTSIAERQSGAVVHIEGGEPIEAGFVVPAMGIRPRDQLARDAGLRCDLFGGIEVDDELLTSDPSISAIGECARHRGMSYGLVAPGYAMAQAVARRLSGGSAAFTGVQIGTRLKVSSVELTVVGESAARGLGLSEHHFEFEGAYRRLALRKGRVIGITTVGPWDELPRVQEAMARAEKIKARQVERFKRAEPMWKSGVLSLETWPDSATVCNCMGVTCGALKRARFEGCANVEALADATGATTVCGTCRPLVATLVESAPEEPEEPSRWFVGASVVSILGAIAYVVVPAIPYAETVQEPGIDVLWRTSTYKQFTGYILLFLFSLSILFSMRKRLPAIRFGEFEGWRTTHALLGALCLVGGFAHTGFRLGSNLDFALISVVLGSILLGGVAGGWSLLESRLPPPRARTVRALLIRTHIYFLWPLPVLLAAHIAKVYFF